MAWKGFSQGKNQKKFEDMSQKENIFSQYAGTRCWFWSLWEWKMETEVTFVRCQWKILLSATFFSVITKKHGAACLSYAHLLLPPPSSDLTNKTTTPDWNSALQYTPCNRNSRFCAPLPAAMMVGRQMIPAAAIKVTQKGYAERWAMVYHLSASWDDKRIANFLSCLLLWKHFDFLKLGCVQGQESSPHQVQIQ